MMLVSYWHLKRRMLVLCCCLKLYKLDALDAKCICCLMLHFGPVWHNQRHCS